MWYTMVATMRTIGNVRGLPELPDVSEAKAGILLYALLFLVALVVFVFGSDNGFSVPNFPYP